MAYYEVDNNANKTTIVNNLTATTAGSALDATQGKALSDKITSLNDSLTNKQNRIAIQSGYWGTQGTTGVNPTQSSNYLYYFNYSIPSMSGYTFLFAVPQIGWIDSHQKANFVWQHTILTDQSGKCHLYINSTQYAIAPYFTAFYVKN